MSKLLALALVLLISVGTLVGSTIAWFTDEVTSANNIIKSGTLDVDVLHTNENGKVESIADADQLFKGVALWEPGAVAVENLTVVNNGSLALKYELTMNAAAVNYVVDENGKQTDYDLTDVLKVGIVAGSVSGNRADAIAAVGEGNWKSFDEFVSNGILLPKDTTDPTVGSKDYGLVVYWEPSADDNNWNVFNDKTATSFNDQAADRLYIDLGVTLLATQYTYESDSFNNQYDADAYIPQGESSTLTDGIVSVEIPKMAPAGNYTLEVDSTKDSFTIVGTVKLLRDGKLVSEADGVDYKISLDVGTFCNIDSVKCNGNVVSDYTYKVLEPTLSFTCKALSSVEVQYESAVQGLKREDNGRISAGIFKKIDPAVYDTTLIGATDRIYVSYVANGVNYYVVSDPETTIVIADKDMHDAGKYADNIEYKYFSERFNGRIQYTNNEIYTYFDALKQNEHSTVFILPGEYKCETKVYIYSSMDVIGLGNVDDIRIIKLKGSKSNQHLINVNGDVNLSDPIRVTLRNLYLEVNDWNDNFKDNAAIQSIRKSKVKCYDLKINKTCSGAPLFVNSYYKDEDKKANWCDGGYMYVENTYLIGKYNKPVDYQRNYTFCYHNMYSKNELYATNSSTSSSSSEGSIENVRMNVNDWWEE